MKGSRLFTWWKSTDTYAVPASKCDGSMFSTVPHGGRFGMFFVTLVHVLPASRVTSTSPSLVPAHRTPACFGDSAIDMTTPAYSTPMLSGVKPPELCCRLLSLSVKSGLISCQL